MPVFAVTTAKSVNWDHARGNREQPFWDEHAAFADQLVARGFVILGGPIASGDDEDIALLAVEADDESAVRVGLRRRSVDGARGVPDQERLAMDLVAGRAQWLAVAEEIEQGVPDLGGFGPESRVADRSVLANRRAVQRDAAAGRLDDNGAHVAEH